MTSILFALQRGLGLYAQKALQFPTGRKAVLKRLSDLRQTLPENNDLRSSISFLGKVVLQAPGTLTKQAAHQYTFASDNGEPSFSSVQPRLVQNIEAVTTRCPELRKTIVRVDEQKFRIECQGD